MPLAIPPKPKKFTVVKFSNAVRRTITYLNERILLLFLLVGTILSLLRINAYGFFAVFGIYVIMYFAERLVKVWKAKSQK